MEGTSIRSILVIYNSISRIILLPEHKLAIKVEIYISASKVESYIFSSKIESCISARKIVLYHIVYRSKMEDRCTLVYKETRHGLVILLYLEKPSLHLFH